MNNAYSASCSTKARDGSSLQKLFGSWAGVLALLVFSGCATKGPMPTYPTRSLPEFSRSGNQITPDRWWLSFEDAALDREVNRALGGNFELGIALSRLRAARALARREASDLCPDLNGFSSNQNTFGPGPTLSRLTWGLDAAYQVDLWGQIRSRVDAERLRAGATQSEYHAVALALSAEIVRTWYAMIEANAQLELLAQQVATNRQGLTAVELRYKEIGEGGSPNILRQRQLVESTLEQIVIVNATVELLEHQLAILTGQPPQTASYRAPSVLPGLPPLPATGVPSELLRRRPDVRATFLALAAADRDLAAAVTDQYPRLDLTGSLVNVADSPETIFRNWFLSIGSQLLGPILDGGQRRAEVDRRKALMCQRYNEYRQTILVALQEVEDGLAREQYQIQRIEKLQAQVQLAGQASEQLLQYFITGEAAYLDVLSANQSQQRLQRSLLSANLDLILIRVGLYLALAGGFDTRPVPVFDLPPDNPQLPSELTFGAPEPIPASNHVPTIATDLPVAISRLPVPQRKVSPAVQPAKRINF